jgi:hypothetical protein
MKIGTRLFAAITLVLVGCSTIQGSTDISIVAVYENVHWYPACATSPIELGGRLFYPLPYGAPPVDESRYPLPLASSRAGDDWGPTDSSIGSLLSVSLPRVAPPGPGDDVGTVIEYSDGMARFDSESGDVAWLTLEKQYYGYVC